MSTDNPTQGELFGTCGVTDPFFNRCGISGEHKLHKFTIAPEDDWLRYGDDEEATA